jgi:hypothetical protein
VTEEALGVPLIVATLASQLPVTPAGRPLNVAPVAPVVAYVMGAIAVLTHTVWASVPTAELNAIVLFADTVTLIGLLDVEQPDTLFLPVNVPLNVVVVTTLGILLIVIGEAGKAVKPTSGSPAVLAAASQSILY